MPHRSFLHLAPPPATLPDGLAVPIDIERIDARLRFNALLGDHYDSTLLFAAGPRDGFPVFDLRQPIKAAWLDDRAIAPGRLASEDLGGGSRAAMRVVRHAVAAKSLHKLRVVGPLGPPSVQLFNRPPTLQWIGPRLTFRFGFTDRLPGRYLESWIPANLIFDEFDLSVAIDLQQTNIPHTVVSNGYITQAGFNSWRVDFSGINACSPLLEIHAEDRIERRTRTIRVAKSNRPITLHLWKEANDEVNSFDRGMNILESCLQDYSERLGSYGHGDHFICMLDALGNGMEYDGATTASVDQIPHEAIHSWWGRGVRPASQADGWIDEAIATWVERGSDRSYRIDSEAVSRKVLASPNPWTRATPGDAYRQGRDVLRHLSALIGAVRLEELLRKLYREQLGDPLTTAKFESFVISRLPEPAVAVTFHRHVHGLPSQTQSPQLDFGTGPQDLPWDTRSIWVRQDPDAGTDNQPLHRGANWVYVRLRNSGESRIAYAAIVARIHPEVCFDPEGVVTTDHYTGASTQLDWEPGEERIVAIPVTFDDLPPKSAAISIQLLAEGLEPVVRAAEFNDFAWKIVANLGVAPGNDATVGFCVSNRRDIAQRPLRLELRRAGDALTAEVALASPSGLPLANPPEEASAEFVFPAGERAAVLLELSAQSYRRLELVLRVPAECRSGSQMIFDLVALRPEDNQVVGGVRLKATVE